MLAVIVPDGGDGPSQFLLLSVERGDLGGICSGNSSSGFGNTLVDDGSSGLEGLSPLGILSGDVIGHGSPFLLHLDYEVIAGLVPFTFHLGAGSSHSGDMRCLSLSPSCFHIGESGLNLLVLGLSPTESPALVTESIWIVAIFWAFSTPSLERSLLEGVDGVAFGNLGKG